MYIYHIFMPFTRIRASRSTYVRETDIGEGRNCSTNSNMTFGSAGMTKELRGTQTDSEAEEEAEEEQQEEEGEEEDEEGSFSPRACARE